MVTCAKIYETNASQIHKWHGDLCKGYMDPMLVKYIVYEIQHGLLSDTRIREHGKYIDQVSNRV